MVMRACRDRCVIDSSEGGLSRAILATHTGIYARLNYGINEGWREGLCHFHFDICQKRWSLRLLSYLVDRKANARSQIMIGPTPAAAQKIENWESFQRIDNQESFNILKVKLLQVYIYLISQQPDNDWADAFCHLKK